MKTSHDFLPLPMRIFNLLIFIFHVCTSPSTLFAFLNYCKSLQVCGRKGKLCQLWKFDQMVSHSRLLLSSSQHYRFFNISSRGLLLLSMENLPTQGAHLLHRHTPSSTQVPPSMLCKITNTIKLYFAPN